MEIRNLYQLSGNLIKDEKSDIQVLKLTDDAVSIYLARLTAGKKLPAHYHSYGSEVYQILAGDGRFEMGDLKESGVQWTFSQAVGAGDIFEVPEGAVHRLMGGINDLQLIFFTSPSHLGNDRTFITEDYPL
jgi:mannose-6-phosphate isomerase-like protein (cupin superfamily)